ncbi:hypothetical protein [Leekyejoonella antrihumi]|uniref:Glycosyl hydrolase n=1 Tax=Leekyejoonella antrihumi TaxID=1660198 RepID=A0A563E895_9MICO|nr:hypothetical protein [Leekyejoonella antrihumi]TWP38665.1 hypothetical protein FGL98_02460 [Leekyejoonella antrihumi]
MSGIMRRVGVVLALGVMLLGWGAAAAASAGPRPASVHQPDAPVYAYFYQWFNQDSWRRAKIDYPLAGRYSSEDPKVLRDQITQAQAAGLNGFLTSWKSTPTLNRRLQMLLDDAGPRHFDVGVVYEGLDFERHPLPIATVRRDMVLLVSKWGSQLRSQYFDRPLIIWTGINEYSLADIRSVRQALGDRAFLLASAKSVHDYQQVAGLVDGDAYYWSSANPGTAYTQQRLDAIGTAVHRNHGIWLAPAAAGFDGGPLGHQRVVPREKGQTLTRSFNDAMASRPDAVGVISWNEWSENTYIEPGRRYGSQEIDVLRNILEHHTATVVTHQNSTGTTRDSAPRSMRWTGWAAGWSLLGGTGLAAGWVILRVRSKSGRE